MGKHKSKEKKKINASKVFQAKGKKFQRLNTKPETEGVQTSQTSSVYKRKTIYPAKYTSSFPSDRFVTPSDPQYSDILSSCYAGLVVADPPSFPASFHETFYHSCKALDVKGMYQFDMTQPTGLGTKVVKTFVSRCLVGIPGITYKYLGLRMFAFPWTPGEVGATEETISIGKLNDNMIRHTEKLLAKKGGENGSCQYNLTLINRCYPNDSEAVSLKDEPMFKQNKCAVSWHADSTLEHFSTIGVYHFTSPTPFTETSASSEAAEEDMWRIALRVCHDAEGPSSGKATAGDTHPEMLNSPSVLLPLPSRHAYFLLDDFNHHHQHAVVAASSHRISSTHRVCRTDGHTFDSIRRRCINALQSPNKLSPKVIRSQQLALTDVECEWIRQFYIQGSRHQSLHVWWSQPMAELVRLWVQLECATAFVLQVLQEAAVPCVIDQQSDVSKRYRKKMAKIRKFCGAVEIAAFDAIVECMKERQEKRQGWKLRAADKVFRTVSADYRPLPPPLLFTDYCPSSLSPLFIPSTAGGDDANNDYEHDGKNGNEVAQSPLPERLGAIVQHVEQLTTTFQN